MTGQSETREFKVGDWVNTRGDSESGNRDPGRVEVIREDGDLMVRWLWKNGWGGNLHRWDADELVRISAPETFPPRATA